MAIEIQKKITNISEHVLHFDSCENHRLKVDLEIIVE